MSNEASKKTTKTAKPTAFNPFGGNAPEQRKPAIQILQENFGIGIMAYDRGVDVWNADKVDEAGKDAPGWEHEANESLECVVVFAVNEGKGTGRQIIPATEFHDYVDALQAIIDSDYEEPKTADRTEYVPTNRIAQESFKLVRPKVGVTQSDGTVKSVVDAKAARNIVSVRSTGGKGAKPMLIPQNEFPAIVEMLRGIGEDLDSHVERAWDGYKLQHPDAAAELNVDDTSETAPGELKADSSVGSDSDS